MNKFKITLRYKDNNEYIYVIIAKNFIEAKTELKHRIGNYEHEASIVKVTKNGLEFYN